MCTMEFLRQTNARIVAFEPNPTNLYYLTRTLQHAATRDPDVAETATLTWPCRLPDCVRKRTFQKPNLCHQWQPRQRCHRSARL